MREYNYKYPENYSKEEQYLGHALSLMTLDSLAPISEYYILTENAQKASKSIITNEIPKIYINASWGIESEKDLIELSKWINSQIEINNLNIKPRPTKFSEKELKEVLDSYVKVREEILFPYIEKIGNCELKNLPGEHLIYMQKPNEASKIIQEFKKKKIDQ